MISPANPPGNANAAPPPMLYNVPANTAPPPTPHVPLVPRPAAQPRRSQAASSSNQGPAPESSSFDKHEGSDALKEELGILRMNVEMTTKLSTDAPTRENFLMEGVGMRS